MAVVKLRSAKSVNAVVPEVVGSTLVRVPPPAEYDPLADTSFVVEYAVVDASKVAEEVNRASLKVLPPEFLKLCVPSNSCFLNEVGIACVIAISIFS